MKRIGRCPAPRLCASSALISSLLLYVGISSCSAMAQQPSLAGSQRAGTRGDAPEETLRRVQLLQDAVTRSEVQLAQSQEEIRQLRQALTLLQTQLGSAAAPQSANAGPASASSSSADLEVLREKQAMQQVEIATQEQAKVETESKFPLKLTGMVLLNGFVNSRQVDLPVTPTFALSGIGSTGASLRQTVLGLNARGPHLYGARSSADVLVDFYGSSSTSSYSNSPGLLRLRTAHASLFWKQADLFVELDRPILSPETPTSLTAIALPPLAWSGNLWAWNPQIGARYRLPLSGGTQLQVEAALIDPADPPNLTATAAPTILPNPNWAERSSRPGGELHLSLQRSGLGRSAGYLDAGDPQKGASLGVGGYFSPHRTPANTTFNAWGGTIDFRLPLPARLLLNGSAFRGAALGGLGAGAFKDFVVQTNAQGTDVQVLDDVGGWAQLKQQVNERLEWNLAYGIDSVFAGQLRPYASTNLAAYTDLARNRTFTANVIFSPKSPLAFSFEYRHLQSSPVNAPTSPANLFGAAAAYKF